MAGKTATQKKLKSRFFERGGWVCWHYFGRRFSGKFFYSKKVSKHFEF